MGRVTAGTFRISSNRVKATSAPAEATIPGYVDVSVGGDIHVVSGFRHLRRPDARGRSRLLRVHAAQLQQVDPAADPAAALSPPASPPSGRGRPSSRSPTSYLLLKYDNGTYTAYTDGTLAAHLHAHRWPSATEVEAHTRVGLGSVDDTAVTFDNFMVYPL